MSGGRFRVANNCILSVKASKLVVGLNPLLDNILYTFLNNNIMKILFTHCLIMMSIQTNVLE